MIEYFNNFKHFRLRVWTYQNWVLYSFEYLTIFDPNTVVNSFLWLTFNRTMKMLKNTKPKGLWLLGKYLWQLCSLKACHRFQMEIISDYFYSILLNLQWKPKSSSKANISRTEKHHHTHTDWCWHLRRRLRFTDD